jgi:predicted ester cyclase
MQDGRLQTGLRVYPIVSDNVLTGYQPRYVSEQELVEIDALLAVGFTFRGSLGIQTQGRTEWREYRDLVRAGSSDFHNQVQTLVVDGTQAAARLLYSGTHDGSLAGMAPTGRRFAYAGAAFFTADHGQLTSGWVLGDLASLREQLDT